MPGGAENGPDSGGQTRFAAFACLQAGVERVRILLRADMRAIV